MEISASSTPLHHSTTPSLHHSSLHHSSLHHASADSVHRNIAEGYCRRSIREYIQHLYIALSSLGESVSGYHAYLKAGQLAKDDFEILDHQAFKLENGLLRLIESLERKRDSATWSETLIVSESNSVYTSENIELGAKTRTADLV